MEIEKTIHSLSNKIWYRFIKVLYILCFLFISSIALFFSYDAYKPKKIFDNEKSYIQCTATEGALYGLALNGVYLQSGYISFDNDKKFREWCLNAPALHDLLAEKAKREQSKINPADIVWDDEKQKPITRQRGNIDFREEPETIGERSGGRWQDDPIIPDTPYKLVPHYKTEGTWNNFVIAGIVSIMTIFLIFETGRRIFYYVILGSLFPRKKA